MSEADELLARLELTRLDELLAQPASAGRSVNGAVITYSQKVP